MLLCNSGLNRKKERGRSREGARDQRSRRRAPKTCNELPRFGPTMSLNGVRPVRLPHGRLRLVTKPSLTGSLPIWKTIGIVASEDRGTLHRAPFTPAGFAKLVERAGKAARLAELDI